MKGFFTQLDENNLIKEWVDVLDWILNDHRFSPDKGWSSGYVGQFTKKVKKFDGFGESGFMSKPQKELVFPNESVGFTPLVLMQKDQSEGKELIRHIRNGIAHGRTSIKKKSELYIEICDYRSDGITQSAYINMPLRYVVDMQKLYNDIEKAQSMDRNNKSIKRKHSRGKGEHHV